MNDAGAISNRTPLLDRVNDPADLRGLSMDELKQLADELRAETIDVVSVTGRPTPIRRCVAS